MADLYFYNTASRQKEHFKPIKAEAIRLYVCGPTVYDYAHIGNARPVIVFDMLYRLLRQVYGAKAVHYVRNITDVDDKINARAAQDYPAMPLNAAIARLTKKTEKQFHDDIAALGCLPPGAEPRATDYIAVMKKLIERLVANGHAYVADDHVLFSVPAMNATAAARGQAGGRAIKAAGNPPYGRLSRRSAGEMLAGARVEPAAYKRDAQDFVLWKPAKAGEPGWPSPAGIAVLGRPGWHIECSAMSMAQLLEPYGGGLACDDPQQNCFDIHGGGLDLIFPHHENEIAQSCCALGAPRMANFWLHNGFVQVEGQKMSKSLGNFITIRQALATKLPEVSDKAGLSAAERAQWAGLAARFSMLQSHYRQPLDWTQARFAAAGAELYKWYAALHKTAGKYGLTCEARPPDTVTMARGVIVHCNPEIRVEGIPPEFLKALADDMNTPQAVTLLRQYYKNGLFEYVMAGLAFIGLLNRSSLRLCHKLFEQKTAMAEPEIEAVIKQRQARLEAGDYAAADALRADLAQRGIRLMDSKDKNGKRLTRWEKA